MAQAGGQKAEGVTAAISKAEEALSAKLST
jgi:hypothetical protein